MIVDKVNVPSDNTDIPFTSNAPMLIVQGGNESVFDSLVIPNIVNGTTYSLVPIWASNTLTRLTFRRTNIGIKVDTAWSEGMWAEAGKYISVYEAW